MNGQDMGFNSPEEYQDWQAAGIPSMSLIRTLVRRGVFPRDYELEYYRVMPEIMAEERVVSDAELAYRLLLADPIGKRINVKVID